MSPTLQGQLGRLGFDCGRVDGIFGTLTSRALEDFQRNCGLDVDGVCGPRDGARPRDQQRPDRDRPRRRRPFRELERLSARRRLAAAICASSSASSAGSSSLAASVARRCATAAPRSSSVDELDPSLQAAAANRHAADRLPRLRGGRAPTGPPCPTTPPQGFHSAGGQSLAAAAGRARLRRAPACSAPSRSPACACRCCARRG